MLFASDAKKPWSPERPKIAASEELSEGHTSDGLGIDVPDTANITKTNGQTGVGSLGAAASNCSAVYGKAPGFLLVDFFDEGSTLSVVNRLNGISTSMVNQTQPSMSTVSSNGANGNLNPGFDNYCLLGILFVGWYALRI